MGNSSRTQQSSSCSSSKCRSSRESLSSLGGNSSGHGVYQLLQNVDGCSPSLSYGRRRLLPSGVPVSSLSQCASSSFRSRILFFSLLLPCLAVLLVCCCCFYATALQMHSVLQQQQHPTVSSSGIEGVKAPTATAAAAEAAAAAARASQASALLTAAALLRQTATTYILPPSPFNAFPRPACYSLPLPSSACGFINAVTRSAAAPLTNLLLGSNAVAAPTASPAAATAAVTAAAAADIAGTAVAAGRSSVGGTRLPTSVVARGATAAAAAQAFSAGALATAAAGGGGGDAASAAGGVARSNSSTSVSGVSSRIGEGESVEGVGCETPSPLALTLRSYLRCHMSLLSDTSPAFTNGSLIFLLRAADAHERMISPLELFTNRIHLPGAAAAREMAAAEQQAVAAALSDDAPAAAAAAKSDETSSTARQSQKSSQRGKEKEDHLAADKLFKKELLQFELRRLHRLLQFVCAARLRGTFLDKGAVKVMFDLLHEAGLLWEDVQARLTRNIRLFYEKQLPAEDFNEHFLSALNELTQQFAIIRKEYEEEKKKEAAAPGGSGSGGGTGTSRPPSLAAADVEVEDDPDPQTLSPLLLDITGMDCTLLDFKSSPRGNSVFCCLCCCLSCVCMGCTYSRRRSVESKERD